MRATWHRLVLGVALMLVSAAAVAQNSLRIAAVVNDQIISAYDVEGRLTLAIAASRLPDDADTRHRLVPQVLRALIDEKLKMQEAERLSIDVSKEDVDISIARMERESRLPPGGLDSFVRQIGVDKSILIDQLKSDVAWIKVVNRQLRPRIHIGEDEIDALVTEIEGDKGKPEHLVAEIFLPVESPEKEAEARALAQRITQQMAAGAPFSALARTFSQNATATRGGDLGWVRQGRLASNLESALAGMKPGQVSPPLRTMDGIYLLLLRDRRAAAGFTIAEATVSLQQLFLPLAPGVGQSALASQMVLAQTMADNAGDCTDMEKLARESGSPLSGNLGTVKLNRLPADIRSAVATLPVGQASKPLRTKDGIVILMVCKRTGDDPADQRRKTAESILLNDRLNIGAQRYLRELRRTAFVDVRG